MTAPKTIVVATHRRSGTHWTLDALRNNSPDINAKFLTLEQMGRRHAFHVPLDAFCNELETLAGRVLIKVHDLPTATYFVGEQEQQFARRVLNESPIVYVHRDGRDVMVSLYHYVRSFRDDYADVSFADFLRMPNELDGETVLSRPAYWAHHVTVWMAQPSLVAVSYHALENDYDNTVKRIADFLGVALNDAILPIGIHPPKAKPSLLRRVKYRLGLKRQQVSSAVQPRKGKSGDWRNYFSDEDLAFFMDEAGEVMQRLGYV
jgi:hypothetical protein